MGAVWHDQRVAKYEKDAEFRTWLVEECLALFYSPRCSTGSRFIEDYNTATLLHPKFYNMASYERHINSLRNGMTVDVTSSSYDPNVDMAVAAHSSRHKRPTAEAETHVPGKASRTSSSPRRTHSGRTYFWTVCSRLSLLLDPNSPIFQAGENEGARKVGVGMWSGVKSLLGVRTPSSSPYSPAVRSPTLMSPPCSVLPICTASVPRVNPHTPPDLLSLAPKGRYAKGGPRLTKCDELNELNELEERDTGSLWHWYDLQRGLTRRPHIVWSADSKWITVVTVRGTLHVYAINPHGGNPLGASHLLGAGRITNMTEPPRAPVSLSPVFRTHMSSGITT
ncbi:hypothetical protein RSAG8_13063, partial [Rhizoctonia solani AG-8 WAC10335]